METKTIDGLALYFEAGEREAAELIGAACARSARLVGELWGLEPPADCRVYVMTSLLGFVFQAAPWPWRLLLGLSLPLWYPRQRKIWPYAGGYAQRFGRRRTIGIKPPRLMALANRSIGERLFVPEADMEEKVRHTTCHELAHAFSDHLKLPVWLHEGLAMRTVDSFAGRPTIRPDTLDLLAQSSRPGARSYRQVSVKNRRAQEAAIRIYARGYWLTRYLDETQPELLRGLLAGGESHAALEGRVAAALGLSRKQFWQEIDGRVMAYFGQEGKDG